VKKLHENFEENNRNVYQQQAALADLYLAMQEWIKIDWDDWHVSQLAQLPPHLQPARVMSLLTGVTTQSLWWDSVNISAIHEQLAYDALTWQTWTEECVAPLTHLTAKPALNHVPVNHVPLPEPVANPEPRVPATPSAPAAPVQVESAQPAPKYSNTPPRAARLPLSQMANVTHHAAALATAAAHHETVRTEHTARLTELRTQLKSLWRVEVKHLRRLMSCGASCARPVEFACQIQERALNEHAKTLVESLHEATEHVDYVVDEELCVHALTVELTVAQLTAQYGAETDPTLRKEFFDGATMLYFWMHNAMTAAVTDYPPSRLLFEHVLVRLARDYLATAAEHVTPFMTAVLRDSQSLQLFVDYFTPNIAPAQFVTCYKIAVEHVSKFDPQLTATLFRRFDVARWLSTGPAVEEVARLITLSGSVAVKSVPQGLVLDLPLQIVLSHFALLSRADWPRHVHATLQFVADQSRRARMDPRVWDILLALPFRERLKSAQLINILLWLNQYLMTIKRHVSSHVLRWRMSTHAVNI
jgi:bacterioferritin-associated ferredoxin